MKIIKLSLHRKNRITAAVLLSFLFAFLLPVSTATAQGTAFTYQGRLDRGGVPANGSFDLAFQLLDAGGMPITDPVTNSATAVSNGLFTVNLDFGPEPFLGLNSWLSISVSPAGSNTFVTLSPPQRITATPNALFARTAGSLTGSVAAEQVTGTVGNSQLANSSVSVLTGAGLSGGGIVPLGASISLTNTGVLDVKAGGHLQASATNGVITLTENSSTASESAGTLVARDGNSSIFARYLTVTAGISIFNPAANTGVGDSALGLSKGQFSTAVGSQALRANTFGNENTAAGARALYSNTTGNDNTAIGYQALYANSTGHNNAACGSFALYGNTTGIYNAALGGGALQNNTTGIDNSACGNGALFTSTTASNNVAVGAGALYLNTIGNSNSASGSFSLFSNTTGSNNTASGSESLYGNTTGSQNTAFGTGALHNNSTGVNNIALGYNAGLNANGSYNIYIGNNGLPGEGGVIRIGTPGIQGATYLSGAVFANNVQLTSDRNAKENFSRLDPQTVLAKVAALPITEWNYRDQTAAGRHIGPMAQDFHAAFHLSGDDDKHISVVDEGGVALAAIQGLNQKLAAKDSEIRELQQRLERLEKLVGR